MISQKQRLICMVVTAVLCAGCASKPAAAAKTQAAPVNPADVRRLVPKTDMDAVVEAGQSAVYVSFPRLKSKYSVCVFVNGQIEAQVLAQSTEKIIVRNGKNTYRFAMYDIAEADLRWTEEGTEKEAVIVSNNDVSTITLDSDSGYDLFFTIKKEGLPGFAKKTSRNPAPEVPGQSQSGQAVAYSVSVNGVPAGPFSIAVLKTMAQKGELTRNSLVWKEGMPQWAEAGTIKELEPVFGAVPPPLPPR
ncbi:MAG: DUF4339 domain-containing protein [Spirochaetaceae bacterium]|jgi:hypothetical protein|nr:DUF4339 domain-containing protein [Spirochaetaceae bacterium]